MSLKRILPSGLKGNISESNGSNFLKSVFQNRALRMFGFGGATMYGISALYDWLSKPENQEKLKSFPTSLHDQKIWWQETIQKAGIDARDGGEKILAIMTGEMLEKHLEEKEVQEGYVKLREHPMFL